MIYNSDSGDIFITDSEISEKLTRTENHIFSLLVESHGKVVGRDYLLENVWERRGLSSSGASLNQYISILRKKLIKLVNNKEMIITYPKEGFSLSQNAHVENYTEKNHSLSSFKLVKRASLASAIMIIVLFTILISCVIRLSSTQKTMFAQDNIGKCQLISNTIISKKVKESIINSIEKTNPNLQKECRNYPAKLVFHYQEGGNNEKDMFFVSYCPVDASNDKVSYCKSIYSNKWSRK